MTQEIIEKEIDARLEEPDNDFDGIFNCGYSRGFRNGARWRVNSVWHKATEKPNGLFIILIEFGEKEFGLGVTSDDLKGARRWAYIIDLLPERKED